MKTQKIALFGLAALVALGVAACGDDDDDLDGPAFVATLTGEGEVPDVDTPATGTATVTFTPTGLSFVVNVQGIPANDTIIAAHIHAPSPDSVAVNAPIVVNLQVGRSNVKSGLLVQGITTTTANTAISIDSVRALIQDTLAYVNVHTARNTGGHIRGHLFPR